MRYSSCMPSTNHSRGILRIQALPEYVESLSVELEALFNLSAVETHRPHTTEVQLDVYFDTEVEAQLALKALPDALPLLSAEVTRFSLEIRYPRRGLDSILAASFFSVLKK